MYTFNLANAVRYELTVFKGDSINIEFSLSLSTDNNNSPILTQEPVIYFTVKRDYLDNDDNAVLKVSTETSEIVKIKDNIIGNHRNLDYVLDIVNNKTINILPGEYLSDMQYCVNNITRTFAKGKVTILDHITWRC